MHKAKNNNILCNGLKYLLMPFIFAGVGCVLLFLASLIPQSMIQKNAEKSVEHIKLEPIYPSYINVWDNSYTMDNYTDTLILIGGYNLKSSEPSSILTNPHIKPYPEAKDIQNSFEDIVIKGEENNNFYVRYWQGFRIFIRPLMVLFSYFTLRQFVSWIFYGLMFLTLAAICERKGILTAMCFGVSLLLVNPSIVSHSLQFAPCFLMAFVFTLFLLFTENLNYSRVMAFCAFGILTQFFDFYTAPVLTCGLPLALYLTMAENKNNKILFVLKSIISWLYGYVSMWIVKLLLVTVFTDINGFKDGFGSFATRVGINIAEEYVESYDAVKAISEVWRTAIPGIFVHISIIAIVALLIISSAVILKKQGLQSFVQSLAYIIIAAFPLVWFAVAAHPTVIHAYFQYRSIAVFFAGILLFALQAFPFADKRFLRK